MFYRAHTEIVIVSSSRDIHSSAAYPTNPYTSKTAYKNVTFLPDPSVIKINDVTIALTATDSFNHIVDAELSEYAFQCIDLNRLPMAAHTKHSFWFEHM